MRVVAEECYVASEKPSETIESIEAPVVASAHDPSVDDGRCEDDEKTEEEDIGSFFEIGCAGESDDRQDQDEGAEKKQEGMSEFEEKIEKSIFVEIPERVFNKQAGENQSKKSRHERRERERRVFDIFDGSDEKVFHMMPF